MKQLMAILPLVFAAAACTTTGSPAPQAGPVAAQQPGPAGCAEPIRTFEAIAASDAETGHLNRGVYARLTADLTRVKAACADGREAEARAQLASVRTRYGYR